MDSRFVDKISGRAIPLRGHDIDTDRIIPARFLKCVSFEGLETHAFEDDRKQLEERGQVHPYSNPRYAGARIHRRPSSAGAFAPSSESRSRKYSSATRWRSGCRASPSARRTWKRCSL